MNTFGHFYLDKEKDIAVMLYLNGKEMSYELRTPNHGTGNLITNLAKLCGLPLSYDGQGLKVIRGIVPCYINAYNERMYIFRMGNTKIANIFPDGRVEMKASIPSISKTLMSQTKEYRYDIARTIVKTYILEDVKFRSDLHTHMNANLPADILIALGIRHQIRYPLYYIKKLDLRLNEKQRKLLEERREAAAELYADSTLEGKYLIRKIDDHTFINFADLILNNPENAEYNIDRIRASLAVMKDGQAVFTNLEKVYLYRYVFTKGTQADDLLDLRDRQLPEDADIRNALKQMAADMQDPRYAGNSLFQNKLLWIARNYQRCGITYCEISDTTLVKRTQAAHMLEEAHAVLEHIYQDTSVRIRFLAAIRRIPLTIVRDDVTASDYLNENLSVLKAVTPDPYVSGCDFVGEEINDIRTLQPVIREIVRIAEDEPSFVIRIHAGENDSLKDNVYNSIRCVRESLSPGQKMPHMRIGHGLYTANLRSAKGRQLLEDLRSSGAVLEFQITSNVRLNNLNSLDVHPLKQYLKAGVKCVQGTDGGALYGTDSIDEQLSLEKMLNLNHDDLLKMKRAEDETIGALIMEFEEKKARFETAAGKESPGAYLGKRISASVCGSGQMILSEGTIPTEEALRDLIVPMRESGRPVVIAASSFCSAPGRMSEAGKLLIDRLMEAGDPKEMFFVIGHRISGYEKYLIERNQGRFEIYSIVPTMLKQREIDALKRAGVKIRISIEPVAPGLYKSFAYEIFKRRPSALIAFDGNSAGANLIQEAKNSRYRAQIFVSGHSRVLKTKAQSLQGYVTVFSESREDIEEIVRRIV